MAKAPRGAVAAALLPLLLLGACVSLGPGRGLPDWPLPDPARAPFSDRIFQDVELGRGGGGVHFLAVLERQKSGVLMVGLSPLGQRLARVRWTARGVDADLAPQAAPYLDPQAMLRELSFALWPPEALDAAFKGGLFHADFTPKRRVLWQGSLERLVVEIGDGRAGRVWTLKLPGREAFIRVRELPLSATQ
jgi:hypothetical protein